MMSKQHALWIARGQPQQTAEPILALAMKLRWYGYTVYTLGDTRHLDHIPPEDHTPYSETGWPVSTPYGWVTACDVMPPTAAQLRDGLPSLQRLGAQLYADRQANMPGVSWLKYMNWGPADDRHAVQDRWKPDHERGSSGDIGHIHLSSRSDMIHYAGAAGYDPVARLRGQQQQGSESMDRLVIVAGTPHQCVSDGKSYRWLPDGASVSRAVQAYGLNTTPIAVQETDLGTSVNGLRPGGEPVKSATSSPVEVSADEVAAALIANPAFGDLIEARSFSAAQRAENS